MHHGPQRQDRGTDVVGRVLHHALRFIELAIRLVWHQKEDRVRFHVLVCFPAYAMWKTLAGWMKGAGLGDAPRTLLYEFAEIKNGDIVRPAESVGGTRTTVRLRHVTRHPLRIRRGCGVGLRRDFVFLGRAAMYDVCALGGRGGDQVVAIVQTQLRQVMKQLGCETLAELPRRLA